MRKCLALVLCLFLFAGCGTKTPDPVAVKFTCDFSAQYAELAFSGSLQRDMAGTLCLSLDTPESLSGMELVWNGETATVSLGALQYTLDAAMPEAAAPRLLLGALDDLFYAASSGTLVTENGQFSGRIGSYAYSLQTDPQTGTVTALECPDAAFSAQFSNVQKTA